MTVEIDVYILDTLMRGLVGHDRHPSAFLVYLFLWRLTHGKGRPRVQIALTDIAENIGLSKRSVQGALTRLLKRQLIRIERENITAIPRYTVLRPWQRGQPEMGQEEKKEQQQKKGEPGHLNLSRRRKTGG